MRCLLHKQDKAILNKVKQCDNHLLKVCWTFSPRGRLVGKWFGAPALSNTSANVLDMLKSRSSYIDGGFNEKRWYSTVYGYQCPGGGGAWNTWVNFAGYVPLASQISYPIIVHPVANYRPHLSHCWANVQFSHSQLSHFIPYQTLNRSS